MDLSPDIRMTESQRNLSELTNPASDLRDIGLLKCNLLNGTVNVVRRYENLAQLDPAALSCLVEIAGLSQQLSAGTQLPALPPREGHKILMLEGWAALARTLKNGHRQILKLLLPGDFAQGCVGKGVTMISLTPVRYSAFVDGPRFRPLADIYETDRLFNAAYLYAQITRIGKLHAEARIIDFMLETHDRLRLCGLAADQSCAWSLTQEMLGETLGLTQVHVNRTIQVLRRSGDIDLRSGILTFVKRAELARRVGYVPIHQAWSAGGQTTSETA